jgi:hypothetical protein
MDKDIMHLAQITLANLPKGKLAFTEDEVMKAMVNAVMKEKDMSEQLYKSYLGDRKVFDAFKHEVAGMVYDGVNNGK